MPELPEQRFGRFQTEFDLSAYDASILTELRQTADYFESVVNACQDAKLSANWVMGELSAFLNKHDVLIENSPINPEQLAGLITRIKDQTISGRIAKQVFEMMADGKGTADEIIEAQGLKQVSDSGAIETMVDEVIQNNADQVAQYLAADKDKRKKLIGFFVGQVMKVSKGQANPGQVNQILAQKLNN
jgi:aspartyl-tRNA(Asn)/glutamyl-tRNA(Gln) amidotransferase subunit B